MRVRLLAVLVAVVLLAACSSDSSSTRGDDGVATSDEAATVADGAPIDGAADAGSAADNGGAEESASAVDQDGGSGDGSAVIQTAETTVNGECSHVPLDPVVGRDMWSQIQNLYAADLDDLEVTTIDCIGADCALVDVSTLSINRVRFVLHPNGEVTAERSDTGEPDLAAGVLESCFYDAGLEPTATEAAQIVTGLWSQFQGFTLEPLPADIIAQVSTMTQERLPIDLGSYQGPLIEEVDGQATLRLVATEKFGDWHFIEAQLPPGEYSAERTWLRPPE